MLEKKSNSHFPILGTKLRIPHVRPNSIPRDAILGKLNGWDARKLTLIIAPAGFGKTSIMSEWLSTCEDPVAWYSIDEAENDLVYFLRYLVAALKTIYPGIGNSSLELLNTPQQFPGNVAIISLLNELNKQKSNFILVLDDYHLMELESIHEAMGFIADHIPDNMHLVISSRSDPPLPLARLRSQELMVELRASDLRFTSGDITKYFNETPNLQLSSKDIDVLESTTEGWITGLQLIKLTLQKRSDLDSIINSLVDRNRYIADYLVEEVLARQSEPLRQFLLETSILSRLSGPLCNAVTGNQNSGEILREIEKSDLFLFLMDDENMHYRYHKLFANILQNNLEKQSPVLIRQLHKRAADWLYDNRMFSEAIKHSIEAKNLSRAASIIDEQAETSWETGAHSRLLYWISKLPDKHILDRPNLCIHYSWVLMASGQTKKADDIIKNVENQFNLQEGNSPPEVIGKVYALKALLAAFEGRSELIIDLSQQAVKNLSDENLLWKGLASLALGDGYAFNEMFLQQPKPIQKPLYLAKRSRTCISR